MALAHFFHQWANPFLTQNMLFSHTHSGTDQWDFALGSLKPFETLKRWQQSKQTGKKSLKTPTWTGRADFVWTVCVFCEWENITTVRMLTLMSYHWAVFQHTLKPARWANITRIYSIKASGLVTVQEVRNWSIEILLAISLYNWEWAFISIKIWQIQ